MDVKSADDYHGKMPMSGGPSTGGVQQPILAPMSAINKPNPYVITEQKQQKQGDDQNIKFTYPKSKIFVGGLDFKLTVDELKEHFT